MSYRFKKAFFSLRVTISSMKFTDWNQDNLYDDDYFDIFGGFWNDYEVYFDDSIFAFWSDTLFMSYNYSNQVFLTIHPLEHLL